MADEVGKIIVRTGRVYELPGQPLAGDQAIPTGLDAGEFGFAVDTGDLFIGIDSNYPILPANRISTFPFRNLRVLTESQDSVNFIKDVVSGERTAYKEIILNAQTEDYVQSDLLVWDSTKVNVIEIDYIVCYRNQQAIRKGVLTILTNGINLTVSDDVRVDMGMDDIREIDPEPYEDSTIFEFSVPINDGIAKLMYHNRSYADAKLFYRVSSFNATF